MSKFTLTIETSNDAFADDPPEEIARILKDAANRIKRSGAMVGPLRDVNGNTVGSYGVSRR